MSASYDVFDVHHHVGDASAAIGGAGADGAAMSADEYARLELEQRLAIMDAGGVNQAAVIPGHGYQRPNGHADTQQINDEIAAYRDATPERFPVAVGIVEPRDGDLSFAEIDRCSQQLGLAGMSFHTRFQGVSTDNQWVLRYVERIAANEMVPVIHALDESTEESLWKVGQLALQFPETTMLVLDGYATYEGTKHCAHLADYAPNLVFDTSLSYNADFIIDHVRRFGPGRHVFGTDLYSYPLGRRISHILAELIASDLDETTKAALVGGTARQLYGL